MKVLVTGATGYIAKHIILQLLERGYSVRGSVRNLSRGDNVRMSMRQHISDTINLDEKLEFVALDLNQDDGWDAAMQGIDVLLHTASPVPVAQPKDSNILIKPAVDGTLRALTAANKAGVKRVVMTSSVAAIMHSAAPNNGRAYNEQDWSDLNYATPTAYTKSKTLAERAAWDYVQNDAVNIDLTVINPGFVFGAPLDNVIGASVSIVQRILCRKDPAVPNLGFVCVDVRDIALMHINAIETQASFGKRYMGVGQFMWFADIVETIKQAFPERNIITRRAPDWLIKLLAIFDADYRTITDDLGKKNATDASAAKQDLAIIFRSIPEAILETATHLEDNDLV